MRKTNEFMARMNLYQVSAFYKNTTANGIGITIGDPDFELQKMFGEFVDNYEEDWKSADEKEREEIVKIYFDQLNFFAKLRAEGREAEIKQKEYLLCITNIWFLENHGFLESDEFNGCVFLYGTPPS